jgi:hypothetical protein
MKPNWGLLGLLAALTFVIGFAMGNWRGSQGLRAGKLPEGHGSSLLLEATLEAGPPGRPQHAVSRVRFLADPGVATCAYLPSGPETGAAVAFVPQLNADRGSISLGCLTTALRYWDEQVFQAPLDREREVLECPIQSYRNDVLSIRLGQATDVVGTGVMKGINGHELEFRVKLEFVRIVPWGAETHAYSSLVEIGGQRLHRTNIAIPSLLDAGFEGAQTERPPSADPLDAH